VAVVEGVAVTVMRVVDVITVLDRFVPAAGPMLVLAVVCVLGVDLVALVPVPVVQVVGMPVVEVVDVVDVADRRVPATGAVLVLVVLVDRMGGAHDAASSACRMASRTIWMT
jgi:hypothetical protein